MKKFIPLKRKRRFDVYVFYDSCKYDLDDQIRAAAKKEEDGCGTFLMTGERDFSWSRMTRPVAENLARRLKLKLGNKVKVKLWEDGEDDRARVISLAKKVLCQIRGCAEAATNAIVIQQVTVVDLCGRHYNEYHRNGSRALKRKGEGS